MFGMFIAIVICINPTTLLMKRLLLISVSLLFHCAAFAQIITPGFISYTACPTYFSQVEKCAGWRQPTGGTSDYFNTCANGTVVGVPQNHFGFQELVDNAYVGMATYVSHLEDYKEYIGTSIAPLTIGKTYTMEITVSLADSCHYGTDGLGAFFSTYELDSPDLNGTLQVIPQVDYSNYGAITDKINWVTLSKTFVADSAYTHIVVGCFKKFSELQLVPVRGGGNTDTFSMFSYYYIGRIGIPDSTNQDIDGSVNYVYPSAFSPNGDGHNDKFNIIQNRYDFTSYAMNIYNRWGQMVYSTKDAKDGWDGTYNDIPQEIGSYYYLAKMTVGGIEKIVKGDVTLIR